MSEVRFTDEQLAVITAPLEPTLVVAGAGSGKTTVMAERIAHLVKEQDVEPHSVLGLTFSNKAAAELRQRVVGALWPDADVTVSTYHSFGASLVAEHGLLLDLDPGTQVLNRAQAWQLLFAVFDEFHFEARSATRPGGIVDYALTLASRCADHLVPVADVVADCEDIIANGPDLMREPARKRLELCQVIDAYERRKRERNLIDYGDQIALAVRLLDEHPDLAESYRVLHPVVLLDEYQDTNFAQRVLLQRIYPPGSAVTAVGDDMQSIYAFRGAHLENLQHFPAHFGAGRPKPLQTNFRSGPEVVDLANRIQGRIRNPLEKQLRAADGAAASSIECFLAADDADEAATIAEDIAGQGAPWSDVAVLCRKRRLIPAIVAALEERGVPVEVVGTSGLLDRPEIVDLVAWLEVLADLSASVALLRLLEGPCYRIGRRDLGALARHAAQLAGADSVSAADQDTPFLLADALTDLDAVEGLSPEAIIRLRAFTRDRQRLAAAAARVPVLDLAEVLVRETGLWDHCGPRGRENLLRFLDLAEKFAPVEGDPGLPAFLEYLHLLDESEEDLAEAHPTAEDAVKVMTIHQAKGLEFPTVFVPGLSGRGSSRIFPDERYAENPLTNGGALPWWVSADDDTGLPTWRAMSKASDIADELRTRKREEEWRLLYVACTRAMRRLICSAAHWYPGPATPQGPSEFYDFIAAQTDLVHERFRHEPPEQDPAVAARERRLAAAAPRYAPPVAPASQPRLLDDVDLAPVPKARRRAAPTALSVTSLVSYARCPLQFYWSVVRPLPRRSSAAARLGTEVHRWIELRAGRQLALLEPDQLPEADADEVLPLEPDAAAALRQSFLDSPYADLDPARVEAPFVLAVGGRLVRGRIDAVYERDGWLELVDFKTGRRPAEGDAGAHVQLDLYALAAVDTWRADPARVRTTYCYLRTDGPAELVSSDWTPARVDEVRANLDDAFAGLGAERYPATAGDWCERCEFLQFCPTGQALLDQSR